MPDQQYQDQTSPALLPEEAKPSASSSAPAYRVLARKYRPTNFSDLIGQEAMVRTLTNAFAMNRIAQAYILTGVRGVGKTTTARIIARALNFQRADGSGAPTVDLSEEGVHCRAILESRHIDVIEMDAASNTSINDIREITDSARYRPVSARIKVYIIDEVHMLSNAAFNGLLKTLEEPPEHVKFIFATTEIRKVPVTVLSRCQRFDLRRIEGPVLVGHLEKICQLENVQADSDALALIARAAEGSVRDALSLLDQAISHAEGRIETAGVMAMMGLSDRSQVIDLFEALHRGDIAEALTRFREQYDNGGDPYVLLADLASFTHTVTRTKAVPDSVQMRGLPEVESRKALEFAEKLSMRILSRSWQILFKGLQEVQSAAHPVMAAEMVLVRLAYAADLPTPDELIRTLKASPVSASPSAPVPPSRSGGSGALAVQSRPQSAPRIVTATAPVLKSFTDVAALALAQRDLVLKAQLEHDVRPIRFEEGHLEIALEPRADPALAGELGRKLTLWTGQRWIVSVSTAPAQGHETLKQQQKREDAERRADVEADPRIQAILRTFPGAQIVGVRVASAPAAEQTVSRETDSPLDDMMGGEEL